MADLAQALSDIQDIRRRVAQGTEFRGYGPATLFTTSALALLTGVAQWHWVPNAASHAELYTGLWLSTGVLSGGLILTEALTRSNRVHSGMADEMVRTAVINFLPAAAAGAVLPFVLLSAGSAVFWMLPGLWQIVFSLGVFASCRCLPRPMVLVGLWFFAAGFVCLLAGPAHALHPLSMAAAYTVGMAATGAILYRAARQMEAHEEEEC